MRKIIIALSVVCLTYPSFAFAQAGAIVVAPSAGGPVLPSGTSIRLRTLSPLNSQDNKTGQQFDMEVAEDVMLEGSIVIPRGSSAVGELTLVKKKGMWGKSGKLEGRFVSIRAGGRDIPIRGTLNDKGTTGTAGVVGAIVAFPLAGFFVTGTSADIPAGSSFTGKLESDIPVTFAK